MFVICKDCSKPAKVEKLKKGEGYFTKNLENGCQCGTDQRRGKARQKWLAENMKPTLAELAYIPPEDPKPEPEEKPTPKPKGKTSKLWWLLVPVAGLGLLVAKTLKTGSNQ